MVLCATFQVLPEKQHPSWRKAVLSQTERLQEEKPSSKAVTADINEGQSCEHHWTHRNNGQDIRREVLKSCRPTSRKAEQVKWRLLMCFLTTSAPPSCPTCFLSIEPHRLLGHGDIQLTQRRI